MRIELSKLSPEFNVGLANKAWKNLREIFHGEERRYAMAYYAGAPNQRAQFDIMTYCEDVAVWPSPRRYWIMSNNQSLK